MFIMGFISSAIDAVQRGIAKAEGKSGELDPSLLKLFSELSLDINDYPKDINARIEKFCGFFERITMSKKDIELLGEMKNSAYSFAGEWEYSFFKQMSIPTKLKFSILIDFVRACLDSTGKIEDLNALGKKLRLERELIDYAQVIHFNAYIQREFNNGNPEGDIDTDALILQKDEFTVLELPASIIEEKSKTIRQGSRNGVSVRLAKGLWFHSGKGNSTSEKINYLSHKADGNLIFTNQRIVFSGENASFSIKKQNIVSVENRDGLLYFHSSKSKPDIVESHIPILDKTLKSVIRWIINQ
ncbi:hypothetical protein FRB17_06690 [Haemophilus influenzae]|nr:hypothetical protein FRB17_06690 [Haemophilus influenzae]